MHGTGTLTLQKFDIVDLGRSQFIIVDVIPTRPANPYVGIKTRGKGAPYKFGPKHNPTKIGTADENHPAYRKYMDRKAERGGGLDAGARATLTQLLNAVEAGDLEKAQALAPAVRVLT